MFILYQIIKVFTSLFCALYEYKKWGFVENKHKNEIFFVKFIHFLLTKLYKDDKIEKENFVLRIFL